MSTAEQQVNAQDGQHNHAGNRLMQALLIAAIVASSLSMVFSVGTAMASAGQEASAGVAVSE